MLNKDKIKEMTKEQILEQFTLSCLKYFENHPSDEDYYTFIKIIALLDKKIREEFKRMTERNK